jgi:hypothetical protein
LAEFIWHLFICFLLFYPQISCDAKDKMLHILALLKFELIQKKVLIFVNSIDAAFRLRLFLEKVDWTTSLSPIWNVIGELDLWVWMLNCLTPKKRLKKLLLLTFYVVHRCLLLFISISHMHCILITIFWLICSIQFGIRSAVLNAELPQNSRLHIIEVAIFHGLY